MTTVFVIIQSVTCKCASVINSIEIDKDSNEASAVVKINSGIRCIVFTKYFEN